MKADEYEDLIRDPSDFWLRKYMPRIFGAFESFRMLQPLTNMIQMPTRQLMVLGNPQIKQTLIKLLEVSEEFEKRAKATAAFAGIGSANGFPSSMSLGTLAGAPFDILGDTLRGTVAIMKDMFQRPDKILEAVDLIADITINSLLNASNINDIFMVTFPLHKGADGWMSQKQFETFYWPSLKKVMNALIDEGLIVNLFAEGSYNTRLDSVNEFPKGSVCWLLDQTDIFRAKKILGNDCCIQGNIPASLIVTGDPKDVKEYCRKLIEGCGPGGGYIMSAGCVANNPRLDNLYAIMEAVRKYGVYKK
jgi:uroporphyrinogen-III decarboxylase